MDEKASQKELGGEADWRTQVPELPAGEELALEPVGDDEIDPSPKWWDEAPDTSQERRAEPASLTEKGEVSTPAAATDSTATTPTTTPRDTEQNATDAEKEDEAREAVSDPGPLGHPEIDLGTIKVKHQRKVEEGEFEALFGESESSDLPADSLEGEAKAEDPAATAEVGREPEATGQEATGPSILPTDLGFEIKPPLIPGVEDVVKPVTASPSRPAPASSSPAPTPPESPPVEDSPAPPAAELPALPTSTEDRKDEAPAAEDEESLLSAEADLPDAPVEDSADTAPAAATAETPETDRDKDASATPDTEAGEDDSPAAPASRDETSEGSEAASPAPEEPTSETREAAPADPVAPASPPTEAPASSPPASESAPPQEPARAVEPDPPKRKAGCWTVFATLFFLASLLVFLVLLGGAYFAWTRLGDYETSLKTLAETQLRERGIHLDYGQWAYQFPRGLVFDEVTFYEDEVKSHPLAKVSALGVNVDLVSLARQAGSLSGAELSLSDSTLTLYEKGEPVLQLDEVDAEILAEPHRVLVERLHARKGALELRLDGVLHRRQGQPSGESTSQTEAAVPPPSVLAKIDFSKLRALQPWLDFAQSDSASVRLQATFATDEEGQGLSQLEGNLVGDELTWHGVQFARLSSGFRYYPDLGEIRLSAFQADYGDGSLTGEFVIDTAGRVVKIERLHSTVDPLALLSAYDPSWRESLQSWQLVDAPSLQLAGSIPFDEPINANVEAFYTHRHGLVYRQGDRELPLSDLRGRLRYSRGIIESSDLALRLYGGDVDINGALNLQRTGRPFNGLVEVHGLSLDQAKAWLGDDLEGLKGRLDLTFRGTSHQGITSFNGGGNLRIEEASLPKIPVLGPVQGLLGKLLPPFAPESTGTVTGAYIVESGVLVTSDLTLRQEKARLIVNGSLNLATMMTRFTATASLEPALATATGLEDKAIVVEGSGPWKEPELKFREFPTEYGAASVRELLGADAESLEKLKKALEAEDPAAALAEGLEEATGLKIDPGVTDLLREVLGGSESRRRPVAAPPASQNDSTPRPAPQAQPERPVLRAIPSTENE